MNKSESIVKIASALSKAQKNIGTAVKGSANPFFRSKYADLGSVMEACKEALNAEGVLVLQPVHSDETGDYVETILMHESGEFLSSRMKLMASKNMQELGSATSYARRYGLQSMVFIPATDDDGEASVGRASKAAPAPQSSPKVEAAVVDTPETPKAPAASWRRAKTEASSPQTTNKVSAPVVDIGDSY